MEDRRADRSLWRVKDQCLRRWTCAIPSLPKRPLTLSSPTPSVLVIRAVLSFSQVPTWVERALFSAKLVSSSSCARSAATSLPPIAVSPSLIASSLASVRLLLDLLSCLHLLLQPATDQLSQHNHNNKRPIEVLFPSM